MRGTIAKRLRKFAYLAELPETNLVRFKVRGYTLKEEGSKKEIYKKLKREYYATK